MHEPASAGHAGLQGDRASLDPRRRRRERRDRFFDGRRDLQRGNRVAFEEVLEEVVEVGTRPRRQLHPIRGHRDGCAAIFAAIQAFTVSHGTVRPTRMSSMPRSIGGGPPDPPPRLGLASSVVLAQPLLEEMRFALHAPEVHQHLRRRGEEHRVPGEDRLVRDVLRHHRLAEALRRHEHDVARLRRAQKLQPQRRLDELAIDRARPVPVEVAEGLEAPELRSHRAPLQAATRAVLQLRRGHGGCVNDL